MWKAREANVRDPDSSPRLAVESGRNNDGSWIPAGQSVSMRVLESKTRQARVLVQELAEKVRDDDAHGGRR